MEAAYDWGTAVLLHALTAAPWLVLFIWGRPAGVVCALGAFFVASSGHDWGAGSETRILNVCFSSLLLIAVALLAFLLRVCHG